MASYKLIVKNAKVILKTVTNAVLNITGIKDLLTGSGSVDSNTKIDWTLQHYTNTATNFTSTNPILLVGQLGIETDDLLTAPKYKIGDGVTAWNTLPYNSSGGGGLSGLTTNKVLKAGSATTAVDSRITDTCTNNYSSILVRDSGVSSNFTDGLTASYSSIDEASASLGFYDGTNSQLINCNILNNRFLHSIKNTFDAPLHEFNNSVTKNGVEVATVNDIPTVDTTIIDGSTNAVSGNAVFDELATKVNTSDRKGDDYFLKIGATTFDSRYSTNVTAFTPTNQVVTKDAMLAMPFIIEETMTFDRIGAEVTVAVASGVCSLLIYDSVNNIPTNLVLDAGTISVTSATYQEITINKQLTAGLYYLVMWHNGPGNPSFRAMPITACNKVLGLSPTLGTGTTYTRIFNANVYTTAPLTYPLTGFNMNSFSNPIISLRRSA